MTRILIIGENLVFSYRSMAGMGQVMDRVKYFLENLDKILVKQIDPVKRAQFFGVFFERIPTYEEIKTELYFG